MQPVVSPEWLAEHRDEVVICDVRWYLDGRSGREAYDQGHLPGAVFVDLDTCLTDPPSSEAGRHPLPDPATFAAELGAIGVSDQDTIVAYDDSGGMAAGRLVWLLRILGVEAALLDGGIEAWSGGLTTEEPSYPQVVFPVRPWPLDRLATIDDVKAVSAAARSGGGAGVVLVDARAPERYRGEVEPIDPRAGHIPGAVNVPFTGNLDSETKRFLSSDEIRSRFAEVGIDGEHDVIVYCGSGVSACHDLLALELAGLGPGRLYAGSWSQWSTDPSRPAATGDD